MDQIEKLQAHAKLSMEKAYEHMQIEFTKIRAGKARPDMLHGLKVMYYGNATPIHQIAGINTPDAKSIVIKPWEKNLIPAIEKAILDSNLGLNTQNDGTTICINIPPLTEERRKNLTKQVKNEAEKGKIAMRNVRKESKEVLKKLQKESVSEDEIKKEEAKLQELTDTYIHKIDALLDKKEKEITSV